MSPRTSGVPASSRAESEVEYSWPQGETKLTEPPPGMIPRCEEAGILGAVAGVIGTLQATEVLKELLDLGSSLSGHLLIYDALGPTFRKMKAARDPGCALCGTDPTIREIA